LNDSFSISSDAAELTTGFISFSVSDALFQMITVSHNYAALLLSKKVGLSKVAEFMQNSGLSESKLGLSGGPPVTTSSDIALFFEKLYRKDLVNNRYSDEMLAMLQKQSLNNKLPKYLPKETYVAHKTGEIGEYSHDGGIIFSNKGNYIIVILSESENPSETEEKIALISKKIYEYFESK
jgi:beta-lactamase class A